MIAGLPDPIAYGLATVLFGGWVGLFWVVRLLFVGKLCTGRELSEKSARLLALEAALRTRDEQVDAALHVLPEVADVLRKFHAAAVRVEKSP